VIQLYTIDSLRELIPVVTNKLSKGKLEDAVRASKCFREIGGEIFLTERDVFDFLTFCSPRKSGAGEPADADSGQIVAISSPLEKDGLVYVTWTVRGKEMEVRDHIQEGCPERVSITAAIDMTYGEYKLLAKGWREGKKAYRNKWFMSSVLPDLEKLENEVSIE
jgi:hypothetical protein